MTQTGMTTKEGMQSHSRDRDMKNEPQAMTGTMMQGQGLGMGDPRTHILVRREHKEKRTSVRDLCISLVSLSDITPIIHAINPAVKLLDPKKDDDKHHHKHQVEFKMTDDGYYEVELKESMQEHFQDLVFLTILDKLGMNGYHYKYHYEQGTSDAKPDFLRNIPQSLYFPSTLTLITTSLIQSSNLQVLFRPTPKYPATIWYPDP